MVWFVVDDGMWSHPKMLGLSDAAGWLWVRAGAYCAQHLTDGVVLPSVLRVLGADDDAVAELLTAGLWETTETGYVFHGWADYQRTREQVERDRENARQRKAKSRARTVTDAEVTPGVTESVTRDERRTDAVSHTSLALPSPSLPSPNGKARKRATPAPDSLPITDDMRTWAAENAPGVNIDAETQKLLDYARANGKSYKDWLAAWRNWMRRSKQYQPAGDKPTLIPPRFDPAAHRPDEPVPMPANVRQLIKGANA